MRTVARILLLIAFLAPTALPRAAEAQVASPLCGLTLGPPDLPSEMKPDGAGKPDLNLSTDPTVCERAYTAAYVGETGLSSVRSLVMMSPSEKQATIDWGDYRTLLLQNGWQDVGPLPLAQQDNAFTGSDPRAGIYTVQHLFRRDNFVGILEATGPAMSHSPEILYDLVRKLDQRIVGVKSAYGTSVRTGSVWPAVSTPTLVSDGRLGSQPLVGPNIPLGGVSGLVALDAFGADFVAVTNRGPVAATNGPAGPELVMPLPAYTPSIVKLRLEKDQLTVAERVGLRLQAGFTNPRTGNAFVTGLPSTPAEPAAFDPTGRNNWGTDPNGVDPEGIAIDPRDGSYWIAEENGPSILHVGSDGTILARLTPVGSAIDAPGQGLNPLLPPELTQRKPLRGIAGVGISPDGTRLFAIMESPLSLPSQAAGEASRNLRLVTLNLTGPQPEVDGMYLYQTEPAGGVGAPAQDSVRVSDLAAVSAERVVVIESDTTAGSRSRMAYAVDLRGATNILGLDATTNGALEQADDPAAIGVAPAQKAPLANLAQLGWQSEAVAGVAMVDDSTIAVVSDNNFGFGGYDRSGRVLTNGRSTRLSIVHLPGSLRN